MESFLVLDVGGTFIKYAMADGSGAIVKETVGEEPAHSEGAPELFLQALGNVVTKARGFSLPFSRAGICFPGPFDYEAGIPMMEHKFVSMKGRSITPLFSSLGVEPLYLHDSTAFLLGEMSDGALRGHETCSGIMLGTGFGFAMAKDGKVCIGRDQRPALSLWGKPFLDGIVEDSISRRAMRADYRKRSGSSALLDVKEIGERADTGDEDAREVFREVGRNIALVLKYYVPESFRSSVVLGGQIARSSAFIIPPLEEILDTEVRQAEHIDDAALRGDAVCLLKGKQNVTEFCDDKGEPLCKA